MIDNDSEWILAFDKIIRSLFYSLNLQYVKNKFKMIDEILQQLGDWIFFVSKEIVIISSFRYSRILEIYCNVMIKIRYNYLFN